MREFFMSSGQNMFIKGQSGELAWVTSSNIPSPLKWFLGPFSDFASSLIILSEQSEDMWGKKL